MKFLRSIVVFISLIAVLSANTTHNITLEGFWPAGPSEKVMVDNNYLYASHGGFLEVYDISDPHTPENIGSLKILGHIYDMKKVGEFVMIAEGYGLSVVSLENKSDPQLIASIELTGESLSLEVFNNKVFIANGTSGMSVVNVETIENPYLETDIPDMQYTDLEIKNNYLIGVSRFHVGADVMEIQDDNFNKIATLVDSVRVCRAKIFNDDLYLLSEEDYPLGGVYILDFSAPQTPGFLSQYYTNNAPGDIIIYKEHALVADGVFGLHITNVTDRAAPAFVSYFDTPGIGVGLAAVENCAFMAAKEGGIEFLNITDFHNVSLYKTDYSEGFALSAGIEGNILSLGSNKVQFLDVADPDNIVLQNEFFPTEWVNDIKLSNNLALILDQSFGLRLLDLSNPEDVQEISTYAMSDWPQKAEWVNDKIYVAAGSNIYIFQVDDHVLELMASASTSEATDIKILDNYAYVTDYNDGLVIFDISNFENPEKINTVDLVTGSVCMDIENSRAYISGQTGLLVMNLTDRTNPEMMNFIELPHYSFDIEVVGNYAYTAENTEGVVVVDVSYPDQMEIVAQYDTPGHARAIAVENDMIYLANDLYGLYIFHHDKDFNAVKKELVVPSEMSLQQNFPNPFNPSTRIAYEIPAMEFVCLNIYDLQGKKVRTLVNQSQQQGHFSVIWKGQDDSGKVVPAGIYFYQLQTPGNIQVKKMLLVK